MIGWNQERRYVDEDIISIFNECVDDLIISASAG